MSAPVEPLAPAASPVECISWLPREELTRLAMLAYDMARFDCTPQAGEAFHLDGDAYAGRETFRDCLLDNLSLLVNQHGRVIGCWPSFAEMDRLEMLEAEYRQRRGAEALADLAHEVEP